MKRPLPLLAWAMALACVSPPVTTAHAKCISHVQLVSDDIDQNVLASAKVTAHELPSNASVPTKVLGMDRSIEFDVPIVLYTKVEVDAEVNSTNQGSSTGAIAFFVTWPCQVEQKFSLAISHRDGSGHEVSELWRNTGAVKPGDSSIAAMYLEKAQQSAQIRHATNPSSRHQYDLIASYVALRSFDIYMKMSNFPLAQSEDLQAVAKWYLALLGEVSTSGLQTIVDDGTQIASERNAIANMYRRKWQEIVSMHSAVQALEGVQRFTKSMDQEQDAQDLFKILRLTPEELVLSANKYAGQVTQLQLTDASVKARVAQQIEVTQALISTRPVNTAKLQSDLGLIASKLR